jgi:3-oxoacyl-[acyl-carrier protein] reductase
MDLGLKDKIAMVCAGSRGLGNAVVRALLAEGCRVSFCSLNTASLQNAEKNLRERFPSTHIHATPCDLRSLKDLQKWFEITRKRLGPPDILVTNTGGPPAGYLDELSEKDWESGITSTLLNVIRLTRLVLPAMKRQRWGRIVHITSVVAYEPNNLLSISTTLRAGLRGLTRLQSDQYAPYGICVNAVLPGHTLTDRQHQLASLWARKNKRKKSEYFAQLAQNIPLRRLAEPDEIASAVAFLCSEKASYITGVSLLVDGGMARFI